MTRERNGEGDGPDQDDVQARLAAMLARCKTPEHPADLRANVMKEIRPRLASMAPPPTRFLNKGVRRMTKKMLVGLAAAAVLVLAVFTYTGFPPDLSGTEGTIGAARRGVKPQMTAEDVKVGDTSAQAFLQSAAFGPSIG
jgi:hypothetical protein